MDINELYHYGILGMKWGVRRYQNKDGTLSAAGKKRYSKQMKKLREKEKILKNKQKTKSKLDQIDAKRKSIEELEKSLNSKTVPKTKSRSNSKSNPVKNYSDEELRDIVNRLRLEQDYKNLSPKQVSKGKAITDRLIKNIVLPAAEDVGRQIVKSMLSDGYKKAKKKK